MSCVAELVDHLAGIENFLGLSPVQPVFNVKQIITSN